MPEYVYHYTSLDALLGILRKEEKRDTTCKVKCSSSLVFWGSRYDCMNDSQDYLFASRVVLPKNLKSIEQHEDYRSIINE